MRWTLFIEKIGLSESKRASNLTKGKNEKKKPCDISLSAKKKLHSVYSECCRNSAIRTLPSHMLAVQTIGLRVPCNCIPVQTGIRDMGTREMQLLQYTAKCFLHLSVGSSNTCSVTDIYTLCRTYADSSWRNRSNSFNSSNKWMKANSM